MPNWVDASAMLSDASRYNNYPLHMAVYPDAFHDMAMSGRYLLHVTDGHKTLEYQHPFATIWLHRGDIDLYRVPEHAAATWGIEGPAEHEEGLADARVTWGTPTTVTGLRTVNLDNEHFAPNDMIRIEDTGEAGRLERNAEGIMEFIRTEQG